MSELNQTTIRIATRAANKLIEAAFVRASGDPRRASQIESGVLGYLISCRVSSEDLASAFSIVFPFITARRPIEFRPFGTGELQ